MRRTLIIIILLISSLSICAQSRWLTHLSDSLPVSRLSIPGSHDSATGEGIKGVIKQGITQNKSISGQWQCGIRAFDFRPAICNGTLHICHGPLRTKISFKAAIDTLLCLISENPDEFAIVLMRQERGNDKEEERKLWGKMVGEEINRLGDGAAVFRPDITIGEMRGKILFLSRNHYEGCSKGAVIRGWSHSLQGSKDAGIVSYAVSSGNEKQCATLCVQDFYSPMLPEEKSAKLATIKEYIDNATTSPAGCWSINHLSGYSSTLLGITGMASNRGYKENAALNNRAIYDYLTTNDIKPVCCGIIMLDYAGSDKVGKYDTYGRSIVRAIIGLNFPKNESRQ